MYYDPALISATQRQWAHRRGVELLQIQRGKPAQQNAYIERFNRAICIEALDCYSCLNEVHCMIGIGATALQPLTARFTGCADRGNASIMHDLIC
ncbi:hypothetical protein [Rhodanobacter thiooxydans]|uniref:hypothetical protein n=2 Tax=Rhodanobacter TaxID=75309 RepID=UPI000D3B95BF|nr:hypothetical protein [Rhodanobacter thiooxydans]